MARTKQTARKRSGDTNNQTTPATFPSSPNHEMAGGKDDAPGSSKKETARCAVCRATISKRSMGRHMKEQHSNTTQCYQCPSCLLYSKRSHQIKQHLLKKHGVRDTEPEKMIVSTGHFEQHRLARSQRPQEMAGPSGVPDAINLSDPSSDEELDDEAESVTAHSVHSEDSVAGNTRGARQRQLSAKAETASRPEAAQQLFDPSLSDREPAPFASRSSSHTSVKSGSRMQETLAPAVPIIEPVIQSGSSQGARPKQHGLPGANPEHQRAQRKERARDRTRREEHSHHRETSQSGSRAPTYRERSASRDTKTTDSTEYQRGMSMLLAETKTEELPGQPQEPETGQVTPPMAGPSAMGEQLVSPAELQELLETYRKYKTPKPTEKTADNPRPREMATTTVTTVTPLTFPLTLHVTAPTATTSRGRSRSQDSDSAPTGRRCSLSAEWAKPDTTRAKRQYLAYSSTDEAYNPRESAQRPESHRAPPEATPRRASLSELQSESDSLLTPATPAPASGPVPVHTSTLPIQPEGPLVFSRVNLGQGVQRDILRPLGPPPAFVRFGIDQLGPAEFRDDGVYALLPEYHSTATGFSVTTQVCRIINMDITDERLQNGFTVLPQWSLYPQDVRVRNVVDQRPGALPPGDADDLFRQ